jgi:hypothetical protein
MFTRQVTDSKKCPFRYKDSEWGWFCTLLEGTESCCDDIIQLHFPTNCPFNGEAFVVSVDTGQV